MKFLPTIFPEAWVIDIEPAADDRGYFARTFCVKAFAEHGLETNYVQHGVSHSFKAGTIRGIHYQKPPHSEAKLVRCVSGRVFDVLVDLRPASPNFKRWQSFELTAQSKRALYLPPGFGHGLQALEDGSEVSYLLSAYHEPSAAAGVHYADPAFGISWPLPVTVIAERDNTWPAFEG